MNRALFVTIHMYLSAFFAPFIFLVAISGGLYLVGIKGSVEQASVFSSSDYSFNKESDNLKAEVDTLMAAAGLSAFDYEYVKDKGSTLYTRPTSQEHYVIKLGDGVEVIHAKPSLQSAMIELHKGHGPTSFKTFQKIFSVGLLFIVGSGLWLGLSAARLRPRTLLTSAAGTLVFFALVLL